MRRQQKIELHGVLRARLSGKPLEHDLPEIQALHPKQAAFISSSARQVAFVGGVSSGKTHGGSIRTLRAAYGFIGDKQIQTPNTGLCTAPTYRMLQDAALRTFLQVAKPFIKEYVKSDQRTVLNNGSEIFWRSVDDPDKIRGITASYWWGDEAAMYSAATHPIAVGRLREGGAVGHEWITTTPRGKDWIWQLYVRDNLNNPDYSLIRATSYDNGFVQREAVDKIAAAHHGDFYRQEIEGEFISFAGLVYPMFDQAKHVSSERGTGEYVVGVDFGYANPGVMLVAQIDGDDKVWIVEEIHQAGRTMDWWCERAAELERKYGVQDFICDPSGGGSSQGAGRDFIEQLNNVPFINAYGADNERLPGINSVTRKLVGRHGKPLLAVHPRCTNIIEEFESYQWREDRDGNRNEDVIKTDDHCMDALRYLIHTQRGLPVAHVTRWA